MAYTSKYYDPVKAHEYYINYRKKGLLKGRKKKTPQEIALARRKSTKGLNEMGKAVAQMVKDQIIAERKSAYKTINKAVNDKLKVLRKQYKEQGLSKEEIKQKVAEIRATVKEYKKKIKAAFDEKYYQELDKIKKDGQFRGRSSRKNGKNNKKA